MTTIEDLIKAGSWVIGALGTLGAAAAGIFGWRFRRKKEEAEAELSAEAARQAAIKTRQSLDDSSFNLMGGRLTLEEKFFEFAKKMRGAVEEAITEAVEARRDAAAAMERADFAVRDHENCERQLAALRERIARLESTASGASQ